MLSYLSQNWVPTWSKEGFLSIRICLFHFYYSSDDSSTFCQGEIFLTKWLWDQSLPQSEGNRELLEGSPPGLRIKLSSVFTWPWHWTFLEQNGLCLIIVFLSERVNYIKAYRNLLAMTRLHSLTSFLVCYIKFLIPCPPLVCLLINLAFSWQ